MAIVMRKPEADHIALHLQNRPTQRPLTYSLMASLFPALGGRLVETRITRTHGRTIYAVAVVDGPLGQRTLDVRPSDGINLALRLGVPARRRCWPAPASTPPLSVGGA